MSLRNLTYAVITLGTFCFENMTYAQVTRPAQANPSQVRNPAQANTQTQAQQQNKPVAAPAAGTTGARPAAPVNRGTTQNMAPGTRANVPAQNAAPANRTAAPTATQPTSTSTSMPATRTTRARVVRPRVAKVGSAGSFFYVSGSYFSFADQIFAKVSGQKEHARAIFTGYTLGSDFTRYLGRYIYSWNLNILTGVVDIQRVLGVTYPRLSFFGAQSGPEIGYRVNSDLDLTYGLNLLYRDIEKVGPSFALDNQLNIKFRFSPRLTFFQSLGNYGKPTSYSYSIGLRWLL